MIFLSKLRQEINNGFDSVKALISKNDSDFDKINMQSHIANQEAYQNGVERFDKQKYNIESELNIKLRREAGLAEVSRQNVDLHQYGIHCYKQLELIYSAFLNEKPGRDNIAYFLCKNGNDDIRRDRTSLSVDAQKLLKWSNRQKKCLVRKLNYLYHENYQWLVSQEVPTQRVSIHDKAHRNNYHWNFSELEQKIIFESCLKYDAFGGGLSRVSSAFNYKDSKYAYEHMKHFRNMGSHLNARNETLKIPDFRDPIQRARNFKFFQNHIDVLDINKEPPGYYQRYIDTALTLYSKLSELNFDFNSFHSFTESEVFITIPSNLPESLSFNEAKGFVAPRANYTNNDLGIFLKKGWIKPEVEFAINDDGGHIKICYTCDKVEPNVIETHQIIVDPKQNESADI